MTADTEFHGTELRQGEKIMLLFESANFDESMFENADQFNIQRDPNNHVAFGFGTHFCLGNQLARLELRLMTDRVLERLPDLRLAADDDVLPLRPANFVSGLESMPMVFTPEQPGSRLADIRRACTHGGESTEIAHHLHARRSQAARTRAMTPPSVSSAVTRISIQPRSANASARLMSLLNCRRSVR